MEEDMILEYEEANSDLDILESQLQIINNVIDIDGAIYDAFEEDRVKVISHAMKIIQKIQRKIVREIP